MNHTAHNDMIIAAIGIVGAFVSVGINYVCKPGILNFVTYMSAVFFMCVMIFGLVTMLIAL